MVSMTNITKIDEFASPEYASDLQALPYMQVLNDQDSNRSGFFITAENAEAVNFQPPDEWQPYEARFNSGESTAGFRSLTARFLVLRRSPQLKRGDFPKCPEAERGDRSGNASQFWLDSSVHPPPND